MATPFTLSYPRGVLLAAAVVLAISLALSLGSFGGLIGDSPQAFAAGFGLVASGPISGWVIAAQDKSIPEALWSLLPLSALAFGPLLLAVRRPAWRPVCFGVAAFAWM
jgi:hypothetical protein